MSPTQFRILYRQFLFRMVDLELLAADAQGDIHKLLGQFAALLVFISLCLCITAGLAVASLPLQWTGEHFMIATTMLVVGLFAILSWDSTFPDRGDVMVLAPLPIRTGTIFFAKVAAVGTALSVVIVTLHIASGFVWPFLLNHPHDKVVAPSIAYNPALPPVAVADLEPILHRDLEAVLKSGRLAPGDTGGVTVGILQHGQQRIFAYGTARPNSIYEIGSITKTFTGLALAQLIVEGKASLDEPVHHLLPPIDLPKPAGQPMTLLDLATHRSGLPRNPDNLHSENPYNPYAGYTAADLYEFLNYWGISRSPRPSFLYSNLGFGLLGHALANRANTTYADLLSRITKPLGMRDTVIDLSPEQQTRLLQGYRGPHTPTGTMDLGVLESAGAIRSTAADMLRYLKANLHPDQTPQLRPALEFSHRLRAQFAPQGSIALAWIYDAKSQTYSHNGATTGYTSDAFFNPANDSAVVVLANLGPDLFMFASVLGEHIRERLTGQRAISLNSALVPASKAGLLGFLRLFAAWWITMFAAGAFIYCSVLGIQGLTAQFLPRRIFLRVSSYTQLAAFGIFVIVYFLEPKLVTPADLALPEGSAYLEWSPSYWFLGLFQQLNGSPALPELTHRAWVALAAAFSLTAFAYTLAYFRTMRRIVEEPDIAPATSGLNILPRFGNPFATAIGQFSIRTMLRSRQHRLLLALYLGVAFAATILFKKSDDAAMAWGNELKLGPLCSTTVFMPLAIVGMRVVFALPINMRANWIFRIVPLPEAPECLQARRRALYALSVFPVLTVSAAVLFSIWPWQPAAKHLLCLLLLGSTIAELCLRGTPKLPFTCSYLPGKSNFNISFLLCSMLLFTALIKAAEIERDAFQDPLTYITILFILTTAAIAARWTQPDTDPPQFEEAADPAAITLNLQQPTLFSGKC